ncbi:unnamed protein product [Phytophthora lilii]|uniref:Unnamed protein product n=1 Tax=Phytophthora lilii TaxID=2077276 RepID=A0A9W6XJH4_9STRA|nr:unnamed protein product [Phytophthora lilii]
MAQTYQAHEKARRVEEHNETLSRRERAAIPRTTRGEPPADASNDQPGGTDATNEAPKSLFEPGHRVWLYMERVKPGLTKQLAHRWHGPFRIKKKVEEYAYSTLNPEYMSISYRGKPSQLELVRRSVQKRKYQKQTT